MDDVLKDLCHQAERRNKAVLKGICRVSVFFLLIKSIKMFPTEVNDPVEKVTMTQKRGQDVRSNVLESAEEALCVHYRGDYICVDASRVRHCRHSIAHTAQSWLGGWVGGWMMNG